MSRHDAGGRDGAAAHDGTDSCGKVSSKLRNKLSSKVKHLCTLVLITYYSLTTSTKYRFQYWRKKKRGRGRKAHDLGFLHALVGRLACISGVLCNALVLQAEEINHTRH